MGKSQEPEADVFLAHNKADRSWVEQLATRLEAEPYDGRRLRAFYSEWDIEPGQNFVLALTQALERARYVGVVLTPESVNSDWVSREWSSAMLGDVSGRAGRIIPIWLRNCNIPLFLRVLNAIDFRNPLDFERAYSELARRLKGERKTRGRPGAASSQGNSPQMQLAGALLEAVLPDATQEQLESNLFPLLEMPHSWFRAPTSARTVAEVLKNVHGRPPAFLPKSGELMSFADLRHGPLASVVRCDLVREEDVRDILADPMRKPWLVDLMNKCVQVTLARKGVAFDADHHRFFFMPPRQGEGTERSEKWKSPKRWAERMVARARTSNSTILRWEHQAAYVRFIEVGGRFYLCIEPSWTFTKDGREALASERVTSLATRQMSRESNAEVLNDTRFWAAFLAENKNELRLDTGARPLRVDRAPLVTELPVGLQRDQTVPDVFSNPPPIWEDTEEAPQGLAEDRMT